MTIIIDNFNKSEGIFQTTNTNELMAKKRKLYLHRRVCRSTTTDKINNASSSKEDLITTAATTTTTSQSSITETSLPDSNTFISEESSRRNCCFTTFRSSNDNNEKEQDNSNRGTCKYPKELRICMENLTLNKLNVIAEECNCNNNCSYNENNCHQQHPNQQQQSNCSKHHHHHHHYHQYNQHQYQHHHHDVLKEHNLIQESSTTRRRHNQEIQIQNSYYLLSKANELDNKAQTHTKNYILETTSCDSQLLSSTLRTTSAAATTTTTKSTATFNTFNHHNESCNNVRFPNIYSRKSLITIQEYKQRIFTNFLMILKMLLVVMSSSPQPTPPSSIRCHPSPPTSSAPVTSLNVKRHHKHYQQNFLQLEQRLTSHLCDQRLHRYKQKTLSYRQHSANVSYRNMILLGLSFLSIFSLPITNALSSDFETTLQSSIATLERSRREIEQTNELEIKKPEQVRLMRPERACKSIDIRNDVQSFRQLENCTVIEGFLLISLLSAKSFEDFNETYPLLTEVSEFIIVYQVHHLRSLGKLFPNLRIIRGSSLMDGYALVVYSNSHLEEVGFTNLVTISKGGIRIEQNVVLCYVESIDWKSIVYNTTEIHIKNNRAASECPRCPGGKVNTGDAPSEPSEVECKEHFGQRYCWNSKSCQKFCPKRCPDNCRDENTCCSPECLGGCSPNNVNECVQCRNLSIDNTTCTDHCPTNMFEYLKRRCVTAETCTQVIHSRYENNRQETLVAYAQNCSISCPEGYTKSNMTCVRCGDRCVKKCEGTTIDSVARAKEFHGCTHIVHEALVINIKRGGLIHLTEDLAYGLSSIEVISSSLKVQGTYGMFDLHFLKNLHTIEGKKLIDEKYAFYVLENTDIGTLFNPNQTVRILNGSVYFHFNPKLCPSEMNALLPLPNNKTSFDKTEVSEDSNGSKGSCNTTMLNVTVAGVKSAIAFVQIINPMEYDDSRTFIGYQYLHIEDPNKKATKHGFRPCEDGWDVSDPTKETSFIFNNLKPYTQYAFFVKTLTISTERRNGQSEIHYFKTRAGQPKVVTKVVAYSNNSSKIVMSWQPPSEVNGKLIKYKVRAIYDKRIQLIESRNYCKDPIKDTSAPVTPIPTKPVTDHPTIPENCKCSKPKDIYDDDEDADIHAGIEFENALQNFVYVKKTNNKSTILEEGNNSISRQRRALYSQDSDEFNSFLLRHIRDVSPAGGGGAGGGGGKEPTTSSTSTPSYVTSTVDPHNGIDSLNESRLHPKGYYEVYVADVNASLATEFVFENLKHFSWYILGVQACREPETKANDTTPCGIEVKTFVRTLKLENVDKITTLKTHQEATNSSRTNIRLTWERPENPNGAVVSYTISYLLLQTQDAVEEIRCITDVNYVEMDYQHNGYAITGLSSGNYSIKIRANTLAGSGPYSDAEYEYIEPKSMGSGIVASISIGVISVILLMGGAIYYLLRKRMNPQFDLKIFPSVNPHYISLQYIPDEWEVPRDRVIQLNSLGQGSFGMVYEGILKGYNNSNEDTPCAIKTVNENATDRERMNFLNEACVMKQFDTYHVVHLLGVCSRGQPTLVVMELMKNGDLKSYLRAHRPGERDESGIPVESPTMQRIFQMAIEIADGMAYLAAKKYVHRDLAARNCMVSLDLTVKIGDFGMTRDIYENDYYRKGSKGMLPVRWMPPESLRDGVYSTASDVFSYGVVLWEMATFAAQPYQGLSNDQVLRYVIDGGVMERPENCPDIMYRLMQKCWHHRPSARPSFLDIIGCMSKVASPSFVDVSYYHSDEGQQILAKEKAERSQHSGDEFHDHENDMEDVTTPLRLEEYNRYKFNIDNNSSVEHRGDSSMVIDDDAPHSPYSLTGSPMVVSSTPDEQSRNSFTMSRMINPHNQMLSSAPSTSAGLRKSTPTTSHHISHPHTHPHHRNLYQPTRYTNQAQSSRQHRADDVDAYVQPDEQGYEMYDPSPNYSEKASCNVHDDDEDDELGVHSTAGQNLLARSKARQIRPIMPLSSSMPDDVIGQQAASSLHPSTASAASSNASSKMGTGKYPSVRAVADSLGNSLLPARLRNMFNHKRSGSNASYKSTSSNPNSTTGGGAGGSNNNLARAGRGKSMSGQNLGTIESGGSGSAGSYCANPRFFTPIGGTNVSENPNYKASGVGDTDTLTNKSKIPPSSTFAINSNPNYQVLDESLNTTATSTINNPVQTSENTNYQLMQAPAHTTTPTTENTSSYVMMNEPNQQKKAAPDNNDVISISDNPSYQMMGPLPPSYFTAPSSSKTVLPQLPLPLSSRPTGADRFTKFSSSSSATPTSSSEESDDDDVPNTKRGIKSDRIPLSRRNSNDRSQKKKQHLNNRSRSQSSSSGKSSGNNTTTSQTTKQSKTTTPSSTLTPKEKWWTESSQHQQQPPPPPNGFVGREPSS